MQNAVEGCSGGCGDGAGVWKGLVRRVGEALLATLFEDKALVKGLTPARHGCWGEVEVGVGSSCSTPDPLACRRRLSLPRLPGLATALHLLHLQGKADLTLS